MPRHLEERHRTWEMTLPAPNRDALLSKISVTWDEEQWLGIPDTSQEPQPGTSSGEGAETGQKRPPNSPAGTPRRSRMRDDATTGQKRGPPGLSVGTPRLSRVLKTSHNIAEVARENGAQTTSGKSEML
ncbi:hypothetical protein B0H10DRAFT_1967395 [Mycena sp. CBHHK59/15]|nr:hypothetical protein B0H10DRAFT_1967395 [Mycena sp. CBHHK59/15]